MMPGPQIVYKCPACDHLIQQNVMASGNTFTGTFFSDGKYATPMMSDSLMFSKCRKCDAFYWLEEEHELIRYKLGEYHPLQYVESPKPLQIDDFHQALKHRIYRTYDEIVYIRQRLLWAYNDNIRFGGNPQAEQIKDYRHYDNLKSLLENLFMNNPIHVKLAAEAHRNLGNFNKSIRILNSIKEKSFENHKRKLIQACHDGHSNVMVL
jgi:hypothetical protein